MSSKRELDVAIHNKTNNSWILLFSWIPPPPRWEVLGGWRLAVIRSVTSLLVFQPRWLSALDASWLFDVGQR